MNRLLEWPSTFASMDHPLWTWLVRDSLNFFFLAPWFGRRSIHGQGHRLGHKFGRGHGLGSGRIFNFGLGFGHGHEIFKDFGLGHGLGQSHDFGHGHVRKPRKRTRTWTYFGHACPLISGVKCKKTTTFFFPPSWKLKPKTGRFSDFHKEHEKWNFVSVIDFHPWHRGHGCPEAEASWSREWRNLWRVRWRIWKIWGWICRIC